MPSRRLPRALSAAVSARRFRRAVYAALAVSLLAAGALVLAGGDEARVRAPAPAPSPTPTPPPEPVLDRPAGGPSLAVGITEPNPNLVAARAARDVPPEWARWRDELTRLDPELYRLVIVWDSIQPTADAPPNLEAPQAGCMRAVPPCASYAGVRDQLRAAASRGWPVLVVFTDAPDWAEGPVEGCRLGAEEGDGAPTREAMPAYRALVASVIAAAAEEGADVRYLSPWNEPNHPYFVAPQRAACDAAAPSQAVAPYVRLARALREELAPGQQLVLGETAGILERTPRATAVDELIEQLPRGLVCAARVWSQHAYIGGTDPVEAVREALGAHGCERRHAIWITETGVGPAPEGFSAARGIRNERHGCRLLHRRLVDWHADPQVTVAVQYTLREDDLFPTGLVTTDLTRARAALAEWQAWGSRPSPAAPPPEPACQT